MKVAIYTKQNNAEVLAIAKHIISECQILKIAVFVNEKLALFAELAAEIYNENNLDVDFLISVGGDGTLLDTVLYVKNKNPIIETLKAVHEMKNINYKVKTAFMDFPGILGIVPNNNN